MNTDELIEHVTNDLIAAIENGADTWHMPWHTIATNAQPRSIEDRPYRGLNAVVLALTAAANGWPSGTWATYRGWQRHGAQVRRGERATHVLLWKPTRPATERDDSTNEPDDSGTSTPPRGRHLLRVDRRKRDHRRQPRLLHPGRRPHPRPPPQPVRATCALLLHDLS